MVYFDPDASRLSEMDALHAAVVSSKCIVTVIDKATFDSEWCVYENRTAVEAHIPILPFYDADVYAWADLHHWVSRYQEFFLRPALPFHRAFARDARALLVAKVKGGGKAGEEGRAAVQNLDAQVEAECLAWRGLATSMRDLYAKGALPTECGKLCRGAGHVADDLAALPSQIYEELASSETLAACHQARSDLQSLVSEATVKKRGGGFCGGGKTQASAVVSPDVLSVLLKKDVQIATLRAKLRKLAMDGRFKRLKAGAQVHSEAVVDIWSQLCNGGEDAAWEDAEKALIGYLAASADTDKEGGDDLSEQAAATAVSLLPRLKKALCDSAGSRVSAAKLRSMFGEDVSSLRETVQVAAQAAAETYACAFGFDPRRMPLPQPLRLP